jgi:hypothetical protein
LSWEALKKEGAWQCFASSAQEETGSTVLSQLSEDKRIIKGNFTQVVIAAGRAPMSCRHVGFEQK